jgi:hypothetical protein
MSSRNRAHFKKQRLIIESSLTYPRQTVCWGNEAVSWPLGYEVHTKQEWELSPDSKRLLIIEERDDSSRVGVYIRQSSIEAAKASADAVTNRCNNPPSIYGFPVKSATNRHKELQENVWLGATTFSQLFASTTSSLVSRAAASSA